MEIALSEFTANSLTLLEKLKATGESITLVQAGKPIAQISPVVEENSGIIGLFKDEISIHGDIIEPLLTDKEWEVS